MSAELYKEIFEEDYLIYKEILDSYDLLKSENGVMAYDLSIKSLVVADRYSDLSTEIEKVKEQKPNAVKTEFKDWCYSKYRIMREVHTHCRMIWKESESEKYRSNNNQR